MRRVVLVVALVSTAPFAGCLDDLEQYWDGLQNEDRFTTSVLFAESVAFSFQGVIDPTSPPASPDDVGDRWSGVFSVPNGTRLVVMTISVNFTGPGGDPIPEPFPQGTLTLAVTPPEGASEEAQMVTFDASGAGGFDFPRPTGGEWTVAFSARGNGAIDIRATGTVPITDETNA